jgi:hypothetical protein
VKHLAVLLLLLLAGCTSVNWRPADAAQTTQPPTSDGSQPKMKQWFTTETPQTLPQDKLDKMNLSGAGIGGAY